MPRKDVDVADEYAKDKKLRPEDVKAFREWVDKQPHFPPVTGKITISQSFFGVKVSTVSFASVFLFIFISEDRKVVLVAIGGCSLEVLLTLKGK